jgi:hypothetical protein
MSPNTLLGGEIRAQLADPGFAVLLSDTTGQRNKLPVRRKGTKAVIIGVSSGSVILRATRFSYADTDFSNS